MQLRRANGGRAEGRRAGGAGAALLIEGWLAEEPCEQVLVGWARLTRDLRLHLRRGGDARWSFAFYYLRVFSLLGRPPARVSRWRANRRSPARQQRARGRVRDAESEMRRN